MPQLPRLQQAKQAAADWKHQFFKRNLPRRLESDSTGRTNPYQLVTHEEQAEPQPQPEKLGDVLRLGAVTGFLTGAAVIASAVVTHGTATPVAVALGGLLFSTLSAVAFAAVAPVAAVVLGAPVAALMGAFGRKTPSFPPIPAPRLKIPAPDIDACREKVAAFGANGKERLSRVFSSLGKKKKTPSAYPAGDNSPAPPAP